MALVLFALVWFVAARVRAGVIGHASWASVARDLGAVAVAGIIGLVVAPLVSERLASTQSYDWTGHVSVWSALVEVVGGLLMLLGVVALLIVPLLFPF